MYWQRTDYSIKLIMEVGYQFGLLIAAAVLIAALVVVIFIRIISILQLSISVIVDCSFLSGKQMNWNCLKLLFYNVYQTNLSLDFQCPDTIYPDLTSWCFFSEQFRFVLKPIWGDRWKWNPFDFFLWTMYCMV